MTPRTLIIGLDGATFDIIDPLIQGGYLPTFARLMARGVHGNLHAWPNLNSAAAWSSMITGYNSGMHGIYDFGNRLADRRAGWHPVTGADRRKDPFWRILSAGGRRCGVINVPITYPADQLNGFMLAGMDTPKISSPGFAHPPQLDAELKSQGLDYVIDIENLSVLSRKSPNRLPDSVQRIENARSGAILYFMQSRPWDALMGVFTSPDRVQHFFWPESGGRIESASWTPIRMLYQQIDKFLADALDLSDEETTVLLVSDHGFRSAHSIFQGLNPLFEHLGLLAFRHDNGGAQSKLLKSLLRMGRRVLPHDWQAPLAVAFPSLHLRALRANRLSRIDWSRTRVFADPATGRVGVNLKARGLDGIVPPEEHESLRKQVHDILIELVDPISGSPLVEGVYRGEDVYHGPYLEQAPDIVIKWNHRALGDSLSYPVGSSPFVFQAPITTGAVGQFNGVHQPEGIFIAAGPHIKPGERLTGAEIYDIAPTILYLQDQPIPNDMDGHVLTDIFVDEYLKQNPVSLVQAIDTESGKASSPLNEEGEQIVVQRLRDLGYIE